VTIAKGQPWGRPVHELALPPAVEARTDAEAREVAERARRANEPIPPLALLGGDLWRTVGAGADPAPGRDAMALPCDLGSVLLDGRQHWFVAHLVARRSWWRGRVLAAMNAQFWGRFDVAPRGHPNDGVVEIIDVAPSFRLTDRLKARRRLRTGTHVPHPDITVRRVRAQQETFDPPLRVWLDGVDLGEVHNLSLRVEPDALMVVV